MNEEHPCKQQIKKQPWQTGLLVHLVLLMFGAVAVLTALGALGLVYALVADDLDVSDLSLDALQYALLLALANFPALLYVERILRVYPHAYQYLSKDDPHPFNV